MRTPLLLLPGTRPVWKELTVGWQSILSSELEVGSLLCFVFVTHQHPLLHLHLHCLIMKHLSKSIRPLYSHVSRSCRRSHYSYKGPGSFPAQKDPTELWKKRDFLHRGFTVGIGGPVGSGKTALVYELCKRLDKDLAVVTNDIFTQEGKLHNHLAHCFLFRSSFH
jgi:hypothetical protein